MNAPQVHRQSPWRRLRRFAWNIVATLVIVVALGAGVLQLLLPWLVRHPHHVERWLSEQTGRQVTIGAVHSGWRRGGPNLALDGVTIGESGQSGGSLNLQRAELALNLWAPFQANAVWNEFRLVGLDIGLSRGADGKWQVRGVTLPDAPTGNNPLGALGMLVLKDLRIRIDDAAIGVPMHFTSSEIRLINRGEDLRIVGRLHRGDGDAAAIDVVVDARADGSRGEAYVGGKSVDLPAWLGDRGFDGLHVDGGNGLLRFWIGWEDGVPRHAAVEIDFAGFAAHRVDDTGNALPPIVLDRVAGSVAMRRDGDRWQWDVGDWRVGMAGQPASDSTNLRIVGEGDPTRWSAVGDRVDLRGIAPLAALAPGLSTTLRSWLAHSRLRGTIEHPQFRRDGDDAFMASARFTGLAADPVGHAPGIDALSGSVIGDAGAWLVSLPQQPAMLDFPGVLRKPLVYAGIAGDIAVWRDDDGWQLQAPSLSFHGEGHAGELRGGASFPRDRRLPLLDVVARVDRSDVTAGRLFWPVNVMKQPVVDWLDRGIAGGNLTANAVFRGNLEDWPFHRDEGHFDGVASLSQLRLLFDADWPEVEQIAATAHFVNAGLDVQVDGGTTLGNRIVTARATIPDLGKGMLDVDAKATGRGASLLAYLRATPVGRDNAKGLEGLTVSGTGDVDLKLQLPLRELERSIVDGSVQLRDATLASKPWNVQLQSANGRLQFQRDNIVANDLDVTHEGRPAKLSLAIGRSVADPANMLELSLVAPMTVDALLAHAPAVAFLKPYFEGAAPWMVQLAVPPAMSTAPIRLILNSTLEGVRVDLPVPIGKQAAERRTMRLTLPLPFEDSDYRVDYGGVLVHRGHIGRGQQPFAGRFDLGGESGSPLPDSGIVIAGRAIELDGLGWVAFATSLAGSGDGGVLRGIDVRADQLLVGDSRIADVGLRWEPGDTTRIAFSGGSVEGTVSIPGDLARAGITAHLSKLHWPQPPEKVGNVDDAEETRSRYAPAIVPPLHVWIGDLRLGKAQFGETRLETRPTSTGMRIDALDANSPMMRLVAKGDWNGSADTSRTDLDIELDAPDLGNLLDGFGFGGIAAGGVTRARLSGNWAGSPLAFAMARLSGRLDVEVGQGRLLDIEPGAGGRLFGLLSLGELRRRLMLDFTDFYKAGMSFNSIKGGFSLESGNVHSEGLTIDTPAATIVISGNTRLRQRVYDQEMLVTPKAGVALPVVGAIAAGPAGAAAGFVVQNILGKQIGKAVRSRYRVTGPWDKPVTELVGREQFDDGGREKPSSSR